MEYKLNDKEKAYLKKLIMNKRSDYFRKSKRLEREVLVDFRNYIENEMFLNAINMKLNYTEDECYIFENFEEAINNKHFKEIYNQLNQKEKYIIYEYYYLELSDKEIAIEWRKSRNAIQKLRSRVLKKINSKFKEEL